MRTKISILAVAAALLMSVTSCNKENGDEPSANETGNLKLTIGFKAPEASQTRAGASTAKPITTWAKSVSSLQLLLVNPTTKKVVYTHNVVLGSMTPATGLTRTTAKILNVPAGTHDLYLIANNKVASPATAVMYPNGLAGTTNTIVVGTDINAALFNLTSATDANASAGAVSFQQAGEIFWAKKAAVVIAADVDNTVTTGLDLTRVVGLLRVRINKSHVDVRSVDFSSTNASVGFRIRNISSGMTVWDKTLSAINANNTIFATGGFKTLADYNTMATNEYVAGANGMGVVADAGNVDDFTFWKDYLCFPGGATSGANRFNLVVSGWAPAGYRIADGTALATPGLVFWTGPVDAALTANGILEMNVTLTSPGIGGPGTPPVTSFGNLTVTTDLKDWGAISSVNVPL